MSKPFVQVASRIYSNPRFIGWLKLLLLLIFVVSTNHGIIGRLQEIGLQAGLAVFASLWLIIVISMVAIAFHPRLLMRLGWGSLIILSAFAGDLFYSITSSYLSTDDITTLYTARGDGMQAFEFYRPIFLMALAKSAIGLIAIVLPPPAPIVTRHPKSLRLAAHMMIIPLLTIAVILYSRGGQGSNGLPNQVAPAALAAFTATYAALEPAPQPRQEVAIQPSQKPFAQHLVLVVDESIRGDFLDINSPNGVVTRLLEHPDKVVNFGFASALTNCSDTTGLGLRYGANRDTENVRYAPAIWSYARKAGFRTVYLDAQKIEGKLHNLMTPEEKSLIDEFIQLDGVEPADRDLVAARRLNEILSRPAPHFVYLYKSGSHFPYEGKYPLSHARYQPHMAPDDLPGADRVKLENSYRNVTEWKISGFFQEFFAHAPLERTFVIYTSDHGQNLKIQGPDKSVRTHCTPERPAPEEGVVPLAVISGQPPLLERFRDASAINHDKATHFSIFPTLLVAMGYDQSDVRQRYEATLLEEARIPQLFISGYLFKKYGRELFWNKTLRRDSAHTDVARSRDTPPAMPPATAADAPPNQGRKH